MNTYFGTFEIGHRLLLRSLEASKYQDEGGGGGRVCKTGETRRLQSAASKAVARHAWPSKRGQSLQSWAVKAR